MKRNFKHRNGGHLYILISVVVRKNEDVIKPWQFQVKNLDTGRVEPVSKLHDSRNNYYTIIAFDHLEAGNYQMTLWNVTRPIDNIDLRAGIVQITFITALNRHNCYPKKVKVLLNTPPPPIDLLYPVM